MSINGTIGNLGLFEGEPVVLGKSAAYLNVKSGISRQFVYHSLQTSVVRQQFFEGLTGTTIGNLGLATIRRSQIPLPVTEGEQRDLKQAAMQQLLTGQTRLPGFNCEWEVKTFGEVAVPRRDRIDPKRAGAHDFCIELEHIESGSGQLLGSTSTGTQSSLKSVFRFGDVLFGKLRAYLRKYWRATRSGVCSTEIWVLVPRDEAVTSEFLFQIIQTDDFIDAAH